MKPITILILALFGLVTVPAEGSAQSTDKDLVMALQKGGYIIYIRHPKTHPDQADTDTSKPRQHQGSAAAYRRRSQASEVSGRSFSRLEDSRGQSGFE